MSFLNSSNSEYLSARITQKGRNSIAKGEFNINYFQIGDSEFDYNLAFSGFTGELSGTTKLPHQMVLAPVDKECGVKYPYKLDTATDVTYGIPIENSTTETIRNVMGPAGFVSEYNNYDAESCTGSTIECVTERINISQIDGNNEIIVPSGQAFQNSEYITLVFGEFNGLDENHPVITGHTNSLIYKILSINDNTLTLDRPTPNLSTLTGNVQIVGNKCEIEFPNESEVSPLCSPSPLDPMDQHNPWTLNVVWDEKPIGADVQGTLIPQPTDENLSGYTSNVYLSSKEFFGYNSTGQTFQNLIGETITEFSSKNVATGFKNSFDELVEVLPQEQRCIAIIHYSELGDLINDPERFFKYDDYISYKTGTSGDDISLADDRDGDPISDTEYFEIYIPFISYHRNPTSSTTNGAVFTMDTTNYYIRTVTGITESRFELLFRYLLDESGNRVGKVFPTKKVVIFDDQELVAILDYRSNRRYTLGAPKVGFTPTSLNDALISGTTSQTFWVTYMFDNGNGSLFNALPCNYFTKVEVNFDLETCNISNPSNITLRFSGDTFQHMNYSSTPSNVDIFKTGFMAKNFKVLIQETTDSTNKYPTMGGWSVIDCTSKVGGDGTSYINPTAMISNTIVITKTDVDSSSPFDLESHLSGLGSNYIGDETTNDWGVTVPQFGDEQPFPGSIRLVRATDIEEMNFLINLPCNQFDQTQNPTYVSGSKYVTEVALLNVNKEPLVVAKTSTPIKRLGTQVFAVKLDF
jgi:hypothetical protein